ncbi:hypothetical protein GGI35DRAFT_224043 [Trichoderma velutinum]
MGFWRPLAKLEVKFEKWRNRGYILLEKSLDDPEIDPKSWWEEMEEKEARKEARRADKEARRAAKEQRRRERHAHAFAWKDYIPRFPKAVGYTPLWKLDEMLASGQGLRWE